MPRRAVLSLALVLLGACKKSPPPPAPVEAEAAASASAPIEPPRCAAVSGEPPFTLGPSSPANARDEGSSGGGEPEGPSLPFASEVSDGVAWAGGFAVGAVHETAGGLGLAVVTLGADGRNGKIIPLTGAHGDVEPPRIAARGAIIVAAMRKPSAQGRALHLAKIEAGVVTWGAALPDKGGESQAFDLALGEKKGIVVWDEDGPKGGAIQVSTFDPAALAAATPPRTISPSGADANSPRLVSRPEGYWLVYLARAAGSGEVEGEARPAPVEESTQWIEALPLDANGSPSAPARAVSPKDGHVLVFDATPGPDGAALVVYRPDPSSAGPDAGTEVLRAVIRAAGVDAPAPIAQEESSAAIPVVRSGWLALMDAAGTTRLAPIDPLGEPIGSFRAEPGIGAGEPLAAAGDTLLVERPAGRAVKLAVLRCTRPAAPPR